MIKYILIILGVLCAISFTQGQSQFENPGFEEWEPEDENSPFFEPIDWSSVKTGDHPVSANSPVVIYRSDEAHSGNYSVYLINKYTGIIDRVVTGTVTNGRIHVDEDLIPEKSTVFTDIHNGQWNTPLIYRPDSVVGWYKANPVPGDFPTVKVILHADSNSIPGDSLKWIARAYWRGEKGVVVDEWTRFSTPIDYYMDDTPEYILAVLTSGNGLYALDKSEAWFDDLKLIYNGTSINELSPENISIIFRNNYLNVEFSSDKQLNADLVVVDMNGRVVLKDMISSNSVGKFKMIVSPGIYVVHLKSDHQTLSRKIFIQ